MATIIIKKKRKLVTPEPSTTSTPPKKLSLKPKESPAKQLETKKNEKNKEELTPEQRTYMNNAKAINAKIKSIKRAKRWLMDTWPKVFDYDDFKPLAIGINKIVAEQYRQDRDNGKDLGFGWKHLATSLDRWVKKKAYIEALKTGTHRYNLDGTQSEEILEEHRVSDRQKDKKS